MSSGKSRPDERSRALHVTRQIAEEARVEDPLGEPPRAVDTFETVVVLAGQDRMQTLAGEYHDRFECVDGTWRFTERIFDPRLFGDLSRHMKRT